MVLPDVNVLVNAYRDDLEHHEGCRKWLVSTVDADAAYGMSDHVLSGFLRVVTHPRAFKDPSPMAEASRFVSILRNRPNAVSIRPGERHWEIFEGLCSQAGVRGNLVPDAWFAALAIESGCEWVTMDRDFARFEGLSWRTPI